MSRTLAQAAQCALDCQDACNLTGVLHSFAECTDAIWDAARAQGEGTDWVNRHPIVTMFLYKLADLNGAELRTFQNARFGTYDVDNAEVECKRLAAEEVQS